MPATDLSKDLVRISTEKRFLATALVVIIGAAAVLVTLGSRYVSAKPAFSKATHYQCAKCHTGKPSKATVNGFGKAWLSKQK